MAVPEMTIKAGDVVDESRLNIHIKGLKIAMLRIAASAILFRFAAFVAGMESEITIEVTKKEDVR